MLGRGWDDALRPSFGAMGSMSLLSNEVYNAVRIKELAMQSIVSVMLRESGRFWITAGAAGGGELPECAEPFLLRVALPVALGKSLGMDPMGCAKLGGKAHSQEESIDDCIRWLRWSVDLPSGSFDALGLGSKEGQREAARIISAPFGVGLHPDFEIPGIRDIKSPGGDWASASREPEDMYRLYAVLEAKAIAELSSASNSTGQRQIRL